MAGWSEEVGGEHGDDLGVDLVGDDLAVGGDVVEHLVQGGRLDLLAFELLAGIVEVEYDEHWRATFLQRGRGGRTASPLFGKRKGREGELRWSVGMKKESQVGAAKRTVEVRELFELYLFCDVEAGSSSACAGASLR